MKATVLVITPLSPQQKSALENHFTVLEAWEPAGRAAVSGQLGDVQIVLTNGTIGFNAQEIDSVPRLSLLCAMGAGYENLDIAYARTRGIVVSNGAGTNDNCVADHAMALLLSAVRRIPALNQATRDGVWRENLPVDQGICGKRVGIIGLGNIGEKIARRAAGFECEIGYNTRSERAGSPWRYFSSLTDMAHWADFLIAALPGGADTRHIVNADILRALGPKGFLVNIARGSIVDTVALAAALAAGEIAGAGLDVYESEPLPPAELTGFEQVILTPHIAGRSPDAMQATINLFISNALQHLAGEAVSTPL